MDLLVFAAVAGAGIQVFTAVWAAVTPREGRVPDRLLALLLAVFAANTLHPVLFGSEGAVFHAGRLVLEPIQYAIPLVMLWYVRSLDGRWWGAETLVLVIPVGFLIFNAFQPPPLTTVLFWAVLTAVSVAFFFPLVSRLRRRLARLKGEFSNLNGLDPLWMTGLLVVLWHLFGVYAASLTLLLHVPGFPLRPALSVAMALTGVYLAWRALVRSPRLVPPPEKPASRPVDAGEADRLLRLLSERRLFLRPELTLDDVAAEAGLSRHEVSALLNQGLGSTFYDVVNQLRVEEFQKLCLDPTRRGDKILTLAFDAGFNSKPSFNLVFKKVTKQTPSQYRQTAIVSQPNA
jgi:AraC-like DNA-binding protein